ncbi:MAG: DNA polymerase III subunit gamma/tau [Desulfovibrionaceae bacterium]|nr:DNA polymerase III subunit gamma/tau [Desulfovibrionaceae bacterium]
MNEGKKLSLAARYRPQTFQDVAGQDMVKAVLSRACAEDRPACAYLFSGTRGVGKTTVARIFAKALNCAHAPVAEPCNECAQCRKIMQGNHVDVVEIDGASNNSVEDVRTLRETVGYAPMEGRYKVFIIDEAHMLTSSAFNALLKTLEEPPPHVVFIMATTEAHKFPVTIVSRCQHFTFRHLNEEELSAHLKTILGKEGLTYEEDAIHLIARRAQGSVRDSMSLLDQTLALGNDTLTVSVTRDVLGLAGQEFFEALFSAMTESDCTQVVTLTQTILRRGVDIGFFLRELAGYFRNLFLLKQGGSGIAKVLGLTPGETALLEPLAKNFPVAHLHAAWQLVLDSHRSVVQSTEPASSLELLLLNVTLLPRLFPIEGAPLPEAPLARGGEPVRAARSQIPQAQIPQAQISPNQIPQAQIPQAQIPQTKTPPAGARDMRPKAFEVKSAPREQKTLSRAPQGGLGYEAASIVVPRETKDAGEGEDADEGPPESPVVPDFDWYSFCEYAHAAGTESLPFAERDLRGLATVMSGPVISVRPVSRFQADRLAECKGKLEALLRAYRKSDALVVEILEPEQKESQQELTESLRTRSELASIFSVLDVVVEQCRKR